MNALEEIVSILSDDDKQAFISFLKKKNKRQDVQNISLFKMIETDDISLQKNTNSYHALRKRLYNSLIEFIGNRRFLTDTSQEHEVLRLLVVARVLFEHRLYREAFKCLTKAEAKAAEIEHFSLLNEIYHTRIQFAHFDTAPNLNDVIERFAANKKMMEQEEQMNVAYALLRRELSEIYHQGKIIDFSKFVKDTLEQQGVSADALTFKSLYQILFIANEYASINSNYNLLEPFMDSAYSFISNKEALTDKHLYYHIYILYLLANMHFRNRRFTESETFLKKMDEQMQKHGNRYYSRFCMRYFLLLALNKNYSGNPGAAADIAQKALKKHTDADEADSNDLHLALLVFYLQQSDRTALKLMVQFGHSDSWYEKNMGMDWSIKKKLVEVLLHAEFENTELALSLIKSFKRRYKKYLPEVKEDRVLAFVTLVEQYISKPEVVGSHKFLSSLQAFTKELKKDHQDIFVISFIGWLEAKVKRKPVYDTILKRL